MDNTRSIGVLVGILFVAVVLPAQTSPPDSPPDKLYVGLLDDARGETSNGEPGVAAHRVVRPAFEKVGKEWRTVEPSSIPARMTWTVAFDGKNLGEVETEGSIVGNLTAAQKITTPLAAIPSVGKPSKTFAGLLAMWAGKAQRPLVVVSKPYFSDPDGWKRASELPPKVAALVRAAFRRDFPNIMRCKDEEIVQRNWKFPDSSLALPVAYASSKGSYLVQSRLSAGDCGYIDDPNDPLSDPWFLVSMDGRIRRVGSFMTLLDAGDYDNDGKSELIFFLSQPEDTDGFVLFDADLKKQASLTWTYH